MGGTLCMCMHAHWCRISHKNRFIFNYLRPLCARVILRFFFSCGQKISWYHMAADGNYKIDFRIDSASMWQCSIWEWPDNYRFPSLKKSPVLHNNIRSSIHKSIFHTFKNPRDLFMISYKIWYICLSVHSFIFQLNPFPNKA